MKLHAVRAISPLLRRNRVDQSLTNSLFMVFVLVILHSTARAQVRNTAVKVGENLDIRCDSSGFRSSSKVFWKYGKTKSSINPVHVGNRTAEHLSNINCERSIESNASTCSLTSIIPDNVGFYKCENSIPPEIAELVVIDSDPKCGKLVKINKTAINVSCEVTFYSATLNPTLVWNGVENSILTMETNPSSDGLKYNKTIKSVATLSYPNSDLSPLTCRLIFNMSRDVTFEVNYASNNPDYTSSCNTEVIMWDHPTTSTVQKLSTPTPTKLSTTTITNKITTTDLSSPSEVASSSKTSDTLDGSADAVAGKDGTTDFPGSDMNTTIIIVVALIVSGVVILAIVVSIACACTRRSQQGGCCGQDLKPEPMDDAHVIYSPGSSYQPLVQQGASYQKLQGGCSNNEMYSYTASKDLPPNQQYPTTSMNLCRKTSADSCRGLNGVNPSARFANQYSNPGGAEMRRPLPESPSVYLNPNPMPLEGPLSTGSEEVYDLIHETDETYQQIRDSMAVKLENVDSVESEYLKPVN